MNKQYTSSQLLAELRRYMELRMLHLRYFFAEKLTYLLATVVFIVIAIILGAIVVCNFSHSLLHLLQIYVGMAAAYAIVGAVALLVIGLVYWQRRRWILNPLTRTLSRLLVDNNNNNRT